MVNTDVKSIDKTQGVILVLTRFVKLKDTLEGTYYGFKGSATAQQFFEYLGLPATGTCTPDQMSDHLRSEEHTSELQSQSNLVCRLLLEKKKNNNILHT